MPVTNYIVGIDEAGRGPLAGPVAVGVVMVPALLSVSVLFPGVADSKKLTPKKRDVLYELLLDSAAKGEVSFSVQFSSAQDIDQFGIVPAISRALHAGLQALGAEPAHVQVLLDGSLSAPPEFSQKTIIGGDATEPIISLASIAAKVERDRMMMTLAREFPEYGFDVHKGYGTKAHYKALEEYGLCTEHRRTFGLETKYKSVV